MGGEFQTCQRCKESKPLSRFRYRSGRKNRKDGYVKTCKDCHNTDRRTRENLDKQNHYRNTRRATDENYRLREIHKNYKAKYGITWEDRALMMMDQEGRCAICDQVFDTVPATDHDHNTGKVRGLLCTTCNQGLGFFFDDPERLHSAQKYLLSNINLLEVGNA